MSINATTTSLDHTPFRVFTSRTVYRDKPLAIGRAHASFCLVFPRPYGVRMQRAVMLLNYVDPADPRTVPACGPSASPVRFTAGSDFAGHEALDALGSLRPLRDAEGRVPVRVVERYSGSEIGRAHV